MNREEAYYRYKNASDRFEAMKEKGKAFHNKLSEMLFYHVFACWPEIEKYRDQFEGPVRELCVNSSSEAFEQFNNAHGMEFQKTEVGNVLEIPKQKTKEDVEKDIQKFIEEKQVNDLEDVEYVKEIFWKDFGHEKEGETFIHGAYQIMKEALAEFYLDDLLKMEGKYLRVLNGDLYFFGANEFAQAYYKLEKNLEEKDNNVYRQ